MLLGHKGQPQHAWLRKVTREFYMAVGLLLKDAMAGLLGSKCLLLAGEYSSKRLGLFICVLGGFI